MRYLLLVQGAAPEENAARDAGRIEADIAFAAKFDDELLAASELEWSEVLGGADRSRVVGPDGEAWAGGVTGVSRLWAVRVGTVDRAYDLAARVASELGVNVEVRECFAGAQRP